MQATLTSQKTALQANLEAVLSESKLGKHVTIDAETPADKLLKMLDAFILVRYS